MSPFPLPQPNHLADVKGLARVDGDDAVELPGVVRWGLGCARQARQRAPRRRWPVEAPDNVLAVECISDYADY